MKLETIEVGRIVNAHGIRGEVRVQPRDGDPAFLTLFKTFYMDGKPVVPTAKHVHKSLVLMKFPGVDDMNAALDLKEKKLFSSKYLSYFQKVDNYMNPRVYNHRREVIR